MARAPTPSGLRGRLPALALALAAPFLLAGTGWAPDPCPPGGPDSVVICPDEDVEEPHSCPGEEGGVCPVDPVTPPPGPGPDDDPGIDPSDDPNQANEATDGNQADNEADENRADNRTDDSEGDSSRDSCRNCWRPSGWPFYLLSDRLFPWLPLLALLLALLALIASILALLLAAARRRGESGRDARVPPVVPIVPPGERWRDPVVVPLPFGPGGDGGKTGDDAFTAWDHRLLDFLDARNEETRRVLATLARMGVAWRRAEPDRARAWIDRLEPHPFYKAGQVLFDLLEWEDFMLDGKAATADGNQVGQFVSKVAEFLGLPQPSPVVVGELPPLEPGFYLYRDTVLGALAAGVATFPPSPEPPERGG
jgi:hypothetical protein